jgi:hypothetical protein
MTIPAVQVGIAYISNLFQIVASWGYNPIKTASSKRFLLSLFLQFLRWNLFAYRSCWMITMRTNAEPLSLVALSKKIGKVNSVLPRHMQWLVFKIVLVISDLIMIGLAFRLAYFFRFEVSFGFFQEDALIAIEYYRVLVWLSSFLWILVYWINGLYNIQNLLGGTREYDKIFRSSTVGFLLIVTAGFLEPNLVIARGWLLMAWGFTFLFAFMGRFLLRRLVYLLRRFGFFLTPAVIVGANQEGRWLAEQLLSWETSGAASDRVRR